MSKPVILTIDDEPQVLNAIQRDLRKHFRGTYRILKAGSGDEALETTRQLKQRGDVVALFLADQRMPGMEGTAFLARAMKLFPEAGKVLLTAYADTEAAISSINEIGLDYYLMKPWDPPEQNLYPVLDDLLEAWEATADIPYDGIQVAGTQWSPSSHEVKDFLARNRIPYRWLDIERDPAAREMVAAVNGASALPVLFFPDGTVLERPDRPTLAAKVGMRTRASADFYDLVVIGGGPAGLAAAVYGASEGLGTVMIEREATGGQAGTSSRIENYLGFPKGLSGADFARRATSQAERLGAELLLPQEVAAIRTEDPYRIITLTDGTEISCYAVVLASGMRVRRLQVPGIQELTGAGVYYGAALTEAAHYRGEPVFVVGGANSAGQAAMYFSRYASRVTMVVRGDGLKDSMSQYLIDQIAATPNIEVWSHTEVAEARGSDRLEALVLENNQSQETMEVPATALFIFIGSAPNSGVVADLVRRDERGFVLTGPDLLTGGKRPRGWRLDRPPSLLETSVPGIFAAGDVRYGSSKRVAAAAGEGSVAVRLVHEYLATV